MNTARLLGFAVVTGAALIGCQSSSGFPDAHQIDAMLDPGMFDVTWTLHDGSNSLKCDDVGAQNVVVGVQRSDMSYPLTETFPCSAGMGTGVRMYPAGEYTLTYSLTNQQGQLAIAPNQLDFEILPDQTVHAAPVSFGVNAIGGIALSVNTGATSNCGDVGTGGAGITADSISLIRDNACVAATFAINAGMTQPAGTIDATCPQVSAGPCLENDQSATATGLPSGAYSIEVIGQIGDANCWVGSQNVEVLTDNASVNVMMPLLLQDGTSGC